MYVGMVSPLLCRPSFIFGVDFRWLSEPLVNGFSIGEYSLPEKSIICYAVASGKYCDERRRNQIWILWFVDYRTNDCATATLCYYCLCESYSKFVNGKCGNGSPPQCKIAMSYKLCYTIANSASKRLYSHWLL